MTEVLKQGQYQPLPVEEQVAILWAATNGFLADVPVDRVRAFEAAYLEYMRTAQTDLLAAIADRKAIDDDMTEALRKATENFKAGSEFATRPAAPATERTAVAAR